MINGLLLDTRAALRSLRRSPSFSVTVMLCLGLGIGANVAVFSVVNSVLLQPLPFPEPDRLATVWVGYGTGDVSGRFFVSPQQFVEIRDRSTVFDGLAATYAAPMSLEQGDLPIEVNGAQVSASLFPLVGATPVIGRTFTREDEQSGAAVAVISEGLWNRAYGRSPNIVGQPVELNGVRYTVAGVLPNAARVPADVEAWVPLGADRIEGRDRLSGRLTVVGRLADGVSVDGAHQQLTLIAADIARDLPERNTNLSIGVAGWQDNLVETVRTALLALLAAVGGVLLLGVANVASLLVVRAQREQRHQALRAALGATSRRITRYLFVENGVLVVTGGVIGVLAARISLPALLALQPDTLSPFREIAIDPTVLGFALALVVAVTVAISLFTAWRVRYRSLTRSLAEGGSAAGVSRPALRVQQIMVVTQIALSLVLLVGSSLMLSSFRGMQRLDPGFDPEPVLAVRLTAPASRSDSHEKIVAYFDEVLKVIRGLPGVESAGAGHELPVTGIRWGIGFNVEGQPPETRTARHVAVWRLVTPGYYDAMNIKVVRGRGPVDADRLGTDPVAVVSESFAETYWPGEDPIGKRIKRGTYDDPDEPWRTVVGVIADVRDSALAGRPRPSLHFPHSQFPSSVSNRLSIVVRMAGHVKPADQAAAVEDAVRRVDSHALVQEIAPYPDLLGDTIAQERFNALLLSIFASSGLLLAAVGIFGIVSYSAAQRRREFGLRVAFGAENRDVRHLMLRSGSAMAVGGAGIGLLAAYALAPLVASMLPTGGARDPLPYVLSALTLMITTVVAAWIPAQRATRVDPVAVLRDG